MTDPQLIADLRTLREGLSLDAEQAILRGELLDIIIDRLVEGGTPPPSAQPWTLPVGTTEYPSAMWYAYTKHDLTGRRNPNNYAHSGLDLNMDKPPWGNVDVGQPVFAVADGEVVDVGFSQTYRGGVVLKVDHFGVPLYIRYWHLQASMGIEIGNQIYPGCQLGKIDYYPNGYAHCHFDMAWQPFGVNWWFTRHPEIEWANPAYILKTHIAHDAVDAMMARGN